MRTEPEIRSAAAAGQVSTGAAEVYEQFFVPALFGQWVEPSLDAVHPAEGERLLDVGTGTGAVARAALTRVGATGSVVAVDPNEGMLAVAARLAPGLDVRRGVAESLPLGADEADCVTCQFALMFFEDPAQSLAEIARVIRPAGRLAVTTWAAVEESPGYAEMVGLLGDVLGEWAADALRVPFRIGTADELGDLIRPSFPDVVVRRHEGQARFASLEQWLHTDIRGWTLADNVDDEQFRRLLDLARVRLNRFVGPDGQVRFAAPALLATVRAA